MKLILVEWVNPRNGSTMFTVGWEQEAEDIHYLELFPDVYQDGRRFNLPRRIHIDHVVRTTRLGEMAGGAVFITGGTDG
jgi:hypothetical protein